MPIRSHSLETLPGGLILRQFADRLERRFQVRNVETIAMPADNTDGIEHVEAMVGSDRKPEASMLFRS